MKIRHAIYTITIAIVCAAPFAAHAAPAGVVVTSARSERTGAGVARVGDAIQLTVNGLPTLLRDSPGGCHSLILFLGDIPFRGLPALSCEASTGIVRFQLSRPPDADASWHAILRSGVGARTVTISVGRQGEPPIRSNATLTIEMFSRNGLAAVIGGVLAAALALIVLGRRTNVLRNSSRVEGRRGSYEPARCVVAWWVVIGGAVYAYLSVATRDREPFDGSIAGMLAIAVLTAIVVRTGAPSEAASRGFLRDLSSDRGRIGVHAVQFVLWNAVVGLLLAVSTYRQLDVPRIGWQLLVLLAVSAAIYAVFRASRLGAPSSSSKRMDE